MPNAGEPRQYAVFGWVRWTGVNPLGTWTNLYLFSRFAPDEVQNAVKPGDRTFGAWLHSNNRLYSGTYTAGNNNRHNNGPV